MRVRLFLLSVLALQMLVAAGPNTSQLTATRMVEVERDVQLEVLDWGGSGPPLVFLAGFGGTAHTFEGFAQKFTLQHRVLAITRRGFGASSSSLPLEENYTPERLAADIIAVLDNLGIKRAFIAGHSVAGQELSELGTDYPERVAGLIYLEASNSQAFYGARSATLYPIAGEVKRDLGQLIGAQPSEARKLIAKLQAEMPRLQRGLEWYEKAVDSEPDRPDKTQHSAIMAIQTAIVRGAKVYGPVRVPVLSIIASPPRCGAECRTASSKKRADDTETQAEDFASANPRAMVVRLPDADHFVWKTNESDTFKR